MLKLKDLTASKSAEIFTLEWINQTIFCHSRYTSGFCARTAGKWEKFASQTHYRRNEKAASHFFLWALCYIIHIHVHHTRVCIRSFIFCCCSRGNRRGVQIGSHKRVLEKCHVSKLNTPPSTYRRVWVLAEREERGNIMNRPCRVLFYANHLRALGGNQRDKNFRHLFASTRNV